MSEQLRHAGRVLSNCAFNLGQRTPGQILTADDISALKDAVRRWDAALSTHHTAPAGGVTPIDMVLHCPACGMQHVDGPSVYDHEGTTVRYWENPVHRSHLCRPEDGGCGHIWRPADVPTNGVQAVKTTGKADSPTAARAAKPEATDEMIDAACAAVPGLFRVDAMRAIEAAMRATSPTPPTGTSQGKGTS